MSDEFFDIKFFCGGIGFLEVERGLSKEKRGLYLYWLSNLKALYIPLMMFGTLSHSQRGVFPPRIRSPVFRL